MYALVKIWFGRAYYEILYHGDDMLQAAQNYRAGMERAAQHGDCMVVWHQYPDHHSFLRGLNETVIGTSNGKVA